MKAETKIYFNFFLGRKIKAMGGEERTLLLLGCLASAVAFAPSPLNLQRFELRGPLSLYLRSL